MLAITGLVLCLDRNSGPARTGAAVGLASVLAWLVAPTSASDCPANRTSSSLRTPVPWRWRSARRRCSAAALRQRGGRARWLVGRLLILAPVTIAFGDGWDARMAGCDRGGDGLLGCLSVAPGSGGSGRNSTDSRRYPEAPAGPPAHRSHPRLCGPESSAVT